jgi:pimeloyl-ACP methyl ester carboxylesterase
MRTVLRLLIAMLKLVILGLLGGLTVIVRYLWKTPQPLHTTMTGEPRLYRWVHGHIFYKVAGPEDAPPLVLFHAPGIGASSYEMQPLVKSLAQRYRVYVPDLLGFGLSDRPALDYNAELYTQLCQDFVANVIGQPTIIVGSGLSNNYSIALAANRTDLCQQVILLSPTTLFTQKRLPDWLASLILNPFAGLFLYALVTTGIVLRQFVARQYAGANREVAEDALTSASVNAHQFGAEHAALAWLAGRLDLDVQTQLERVQRPVLTIWEAQARKAITTSQASGSYLLTREIILEGEGQRIHERHPELVMSSIETWLGELAAPKEQQAVIALTGVEANVQSNNVQLAEPLPGNTRSEAPITTRIPARSEEPPASSTPIDKPVETVTRTEAVEPLASTMSIETLPAAATPIPSQSADAPIQEPIQTETVTAEATANVSEAESIEAYCVKCRQKRVMLDAKQIVTKKGRSAMSGVCPVCGTQLFRFISNGKEK